MNDVIARAAFEVAVARYGYPGSVKMGNVVVCGGLYSDLIRMDFLRDNGNEKHLYIKIYKINKYNEHLVKKRLISEFNILETLFDKFSACDDMSVVFPVGILEDHNAIITEEAVGSTFAELVSRHSKFYSVGRNVDELGRYCFLAGRWLSLFHEFTEREFQVFDVDELIEYCEQRLRLIEESGRGDIDSPFRNAVLDHIRNMGDRIPAAANRIAGRHMDFAPHNMIAHDGTLTVLDFTMFDYGSVYYDVCNFWYNLENIKYSPLCTARTALRLQRRFFEGYGDRIDQGSDLFRLVRCRFVLATMLTLNESRPSRLERKVLNARSYRRLHDWLMTECRRDSK